MTASLRILTTSSLDSNPSLLIVSPDGSKTLVNCGEGCQRSFLESASASSAGVGTLRVSSVNRVVLTHIGHDTLGGLPGMILTTADVVDSVAKELQQKQGAQRNGGGASARNDADGNQNGGGGGKPRNNNGHGRKRNGSLISNGDDDEEDAMPDLEIVGPDGISAFLHSLRHFMRRDRFRVHAHEGRYDSSANNNRASASFAAKKKKSKRKKKSKGGSDGDEIGFSVRSVPIAYASRARPDASVRSTRRTEQAVSYLFSTPPIPGKFLVEKAQELNVPRGPMYAQLKAGKSVTFVDPSTGEERTVTSEEVVEPASPGVGVAVVYCPTLEVLSELKEDKAFARLRAKDADGGGATSEEERDGVELEVIVHLTPKRIFDDAAYQLWCRELGDGVDHITLHAVETLEDRAAEEEDSPFVSGICGGIRRSFVNDRLYPMPSSVAGGSGPSAEMDIETAEPGVKTIRGCPMMDYVLMPRSRRGLNESTVKSLYSTDLVSNLRQQVKETGAIELASDISSSHDKETNGSRQDGEGGSGSSGSLGELIFTGTGSAVPCKHRNVTGMYLRMDGGNSMLLDVGEGTIGQLLRSWKSTLPPGLALVDEYRTRLGGIKAVWISHPHADHHLGLLRLLSERSAICGPDDPIVLMAPFDMFDFLREYGEVAPEINRSYIPVECRDMIHGRENPLGKKLFEELGITSCMSVPVAHCLRSYAVIIDGTSFGRVSYSGDCRPSNRLADVGFGTDLLIHEATFENGMEQDAVMKRHSTVGEAIDVASKMEAKSLVLTHFSQRYPKIPPLTNTRDKVQVDPSKDMPIAVAFDFMRLTPDTIRLAAKLTPALRLLYPQEGVDEAEMVVEKVTAKELMDVPGVFAVPGVL